jgi:hypothetical protein
VCTLNGWVGRQFSQALRDVRQIEKRKSGLLPNALAIKTDTATVAHSCFHGACGTSRSAESRAGTQHKFVDFRHRDAAYELLVATWRRATVRARSTGLPRTRGGRGKR